VLAKVRERLALSEKAALRFDGDRFNLCKLNKLDRKQHKIQISNRFAALENLSDSKDINRAWENIKEDIKTSAKNRVGVNEMNQYKPWFDEGC
jgi:hypothetical protein